MSELPSLTAEVLLADLIHDLRQDLGNIATSVYCLNLIGGSSEPRQPRERDYLRTIEEQVERASQRLLLASSAVAAMRNQRTESAEDRERTKSTTSVVR